MRTRDYRPLRDPLFLAACGVYGIGRFALRARYPETFVTKHLNDLLCIPIWVPLMVAGLRAIGMRESSDAPRASEVLLVLILTALTFEVLLPTVPWFASFTYADPADVTWYAVGTLASAVWWKVVYGGRRAPSQD
tara:strand:- start:1418 stop:1822 length:405 start_codon:yes stop_codon:yes gene_type:complete